MILVKFDDNYADEFDTEGFKLMTQYELDEFLAYARDSFIRATATKLTERRHYGRPDTNPHTMEYSDDEVEIGFGTNEGWRWTSYEDFMSSLSFTQVEDSTVIALKHLFPEAVSWGYGMFPSGMGEY